MKMIKKYNEFINESLHDGELPTDEWLENASSDLNELKVKIFSDRLFDLSGVNYNKMITPTDHQGITRIGNVSKEDIERYCKDHDLYSCKQIYITFDSDEQDILNRYSPKVEALEKKIQAEGYKTKLKVWRFAEPGSTDKKYIGDMNLIIYPK